MLDKQAEESILELNIRSRAQLIIKNATLENDFKGISKNSNIDDNAFKNLTINDIFKIDFNEKWVHLRKSNTESIIRIYSEAKTKKIANELSLNFLNEIRCLT